MFETIKFYTFVTFLKLFSKKYICSRKKWNFKSDEGL